MRPPAHIVWLLYLIPTAMFSQIRISNDTEFGPEPQGGIERLSLNFLKIDFTPAQREVLRNRPLEFIFFVDTTGFATLEDVNGVEDAAIMDSLMQKRNLPMFTPHIVDGKKRDGLFFMELQFPSYESTFYPTTSQHEHGNIDDLEFELSGNSFHFLMGGVVNSFSGRPSQYLNTGGGFKLDVLWQTRRKFGYGLAMAAYGNKAAEYYPVTTDRKLDKVPTTFVIGVILSREFEVTEKNSFIAQFELAYAGQTISSRENANDEEYIQLDGFSPGIVVNYFVRLGKERFQQSNNYPVISSYHLNLHGAIRPLLLNLKAARGLMFEVGISYRLKASVLSSYRTN
jgi:hypothetical protein